MQKKFLFVINPISGDVDKEPIVNEISTWCKEHNVSKATFKTTGKNDLENLKNEVEKTEFEAVVAVGGDGTALLVAQAIMHTKVPLALVAAGSANGLAKHFEIPKQTKKALDVLLAHNKVRADMLQFNEEKYALHISDVGLNANLVKHFSKSEKRGFFSYAEGVLEEIKQPKTFNIEIITKQKTYNRSGIMLAIANANRYGTGAFLNKIGKIDDGKFELCILKELDFSNIALHFIDFIDEHADYLEVIQCTEAEIKLSQPITFQIDGELQDNTDSFSVRILPKCLSVLTPKESNNLLQKLFNGKE